MNCGAGMAAKYIYQGCHWKKKTCLAGGNVNAYLWAAAFLGRKLGVYCSSWDLKQKKVQRGICKCMLPCILMTPPLAPRVHICIYTWDFSPLNPWQQTWSNRLVFGEGLDCAAESAPPENSDWTSWKCTLRGEYRCFPSHHKSENYAHFPGIAWLLCISLPLRCCIG